MRQFIAALVLSATALTATSVSAQSDYPDRPVTIVVPYSAGGSSDTLARALAEQLSRLLEGNVIVENRPGAGSRVGTENVARSEADGYTLLLADMPFTIVPNLYDGVAYDPTGDFEALAQIGVAPIVLFTPMDGPEDLTTFIAEAKAASPSLAIGSGGVGSTTHMMAELAQREMGVDMLHVPFGGSSNSLQGVAGGQVDAAFSTLATGYPLVEAGSIRPLAVTARERVDAIPDARPFIDADIDLTVQHWWGLLAPSGLPDEVRTKLIDVTQQALSHEAMKKRFEILGVSPATVAPEAFAGFIGEEGKRWAEIIEQAAIEIEQ